MNSQTTNRPGPTPPPAGQGFNAVSPEAMKFLEQNRLAASNDPHRPKFILTKQTLAKRPAEFGPTKTPREKQRGPNKPLIFSLLTIVGVLFLVMLISIIIIGHQESVPTPNSSSSQF